MKNRSECATSLLVRNIPRDCSAKDLRMPFERYGIVKDVYLPRDYYWAAKPVSWSKTYLTFGGVVDVHNGGHKTSICN
jgi:RNA recognition motif-containing protein